MIAAAGVDAAAVAPISPNPRSRVSASRKLSSRHSRADENHHHGLCALHQEAQPPARLHAADTTDLRRLGRDGDLARALAHDVGGINASIALIRQTRGGSWPSESVTDEYNFVDLVWHELEFREGDSFTYAVYDKRGTHVGCCYLYPMGRRTTLTATA